MTTHTWLPSGFELTDGSRIKGCMYVGSEWQIYKTDLVNNIVVMTSKLSNRWIEAGILHKNQFTYIDYNTHCYGILYSRKSYILTPLNDWDKLPDKIDCLAFVYALRETRKILPGVSFHDAIYIEQYSRLLPTWSSAYDVDDKIVLGSWITGGVHLPASSARQILSLTTKLSLSELTVLLETANVYNSEQISFKTISQNSANYNNANVQTISTTQEGVKFCLPGRSALESFITTHVIDIIQNSDKYKSMGIGFPRPIILHGPPGCGKTYAVDRLVEFLGWPSFVINSNSIGSPYIHDTSKKISELFDMAIYNAPSFVIIDEMEAYMSSRQYKSTGNHSIEEIAEFLKRIPEASQKNVLVIGMTNMLDTIDPAILRRGRFDHTIKVDMPVRSEVESLMVSLLMNMPTADNLDINHAVTVLTGKPLSDISFVVREAARLTVINNKAVLDQECLHDALALLPHHSIKPVNRIGFI